MKKETREKLYGWYMLTGPLAMVGLAFGWYVLLIPVILACWTAPFIFMKNDG